ncbi:MAG: cation:proton antiporter [Thermoleophilia bacterium]|jgi:Kef-type K+ transport system membrane component KefB|nr:cation:proton antiporter [Thermoleophilia bacterium]
MDLDFSSLALVTAAGFLAPFCLGFVPALRVPAIVLEILLGILIGPDVLGWAEVDAAVEVMSLVGLSFLLFLAGLEVDARQLRGAPARRAGAAFAVSIGLALLSGLALAGAGLTGAPLLVAVILMATGLGVVVPVLKDAGAGGGAFGRLVLAGGALAELIPILLLTLLFSGESASAGGTALLLAGLVAVVAAAGLAVAGAGRLPRVGAVLERLQDTTAQIRVRGALVLIVGFVALAGGLGLEAILGAFLAGALLSLVDHDRRMTHPRLREKLEAAGYGVVIPVFFVASGMRFDLDALLASPSALAMVPVFAGAMLLVHGLPALLYRPLVGARRAAAAGLLQATTSVGFVVAATEIGMQTGMVGPGTGAALVSAALVSVLIFPAAALALLGPAAATPAARPARSARPA